MESLNFWGVLPFIFGKFHRNGNIVLVAFLSSTRMHHIFWNRVWKLVFSLAIVCLFLSQFNSVDAQCPQSKFQCANGRCIPSNWMCDAENDCGDNSDEADCEDRTCSGSEFECADKQQCIPARWQCDSDTDCEDGSDESPEGCADRTCPPDHFNCGEDDSCIPMMWVCDHDVDCNNGRDESQCHTITCSASEFTCADLSKCISGRWVCDNEPDCGDNSDEADCEEPTCAPNYFQCASTHYCIPESWTCDGDYDCVNGSDEENCETQHGASICGEGLFQCKNGDCIHDAWKCDGEDDCGDDSDEDKSICPTLTCAPHLLTCQDGSCVYGIPCNNVVDCVDGSDEHEFCAPPPAEQTCSTNQFMCRDGTCIDESRHCDGFADCVHGEDEPVDQNCGLCDSGFRYNWGTRSCEDVDECKEILGACSHICLNHNGSFTCKCQEGFQLLNHTYCKAVGPPPAVVYVYHHNIRKFNLSTYENGDLFTELSNPLALEVDVHDGIVFWSDSQEQKIMMGNLNGEPNPTVVVDGVFVVDGIGYDWIHKNLYWTDTLNNTINVASRDSGHRKALISDNLDEPRAIAVDPRTGYMYWTDWGTSPKIERAGMNGAYRETIIDKSKVNIHWPNGLTIDYHSDMLYWVDARYHLLATCDFNGERYRTILQDETALMHPFHISVFQDEVYWTDWDAYSVRRVNKFTGEGVTDVVGSLVRGTPNGLHIWHPSKQPEEENYCETGRARCSHLCVASPEGPRQFSKYTCMCPDGIEMSSDGFTCSGHTPRPEPSVTTESNLIPPDVEGPTKKGNDLSPYIPSNSNANKGDDGDGPVQAPENTSSLIWIIIVALLVIIIITVILVFLVWRRRTSGGKRSMNFDNPVYRKVTEDQLFLSGSGTNYEHNPGKGHTFQPITTEENVIIS